MHPEFGVNRVGKLSGIESESGIGEAAGHLSMGESTEVTAIPGRGAIRMAPRQIGEALSVHYPVPQLRDEALGLLATAGMPLLGRWPFHSIFEQYM